MGRKLAVYAFSLGAAVAFMTGAVVTRYRTTMLAGTMAAGDPRLVPAGSLFAPSSEVRLALLSPGDARATGAAAAPRCLVRRAGVSAPMLAFGEPARPEATPASIRELRVPGSTISGERLRGLGEAERSALRGTLRATLLVMRPTPPGLTAMVEGARLVADCARETGSLVADPATGEIFTASSFRAHRVEGWSEGLPLLPSHFVVARTVAPGGAVALRTFGLAKFGLPELEVSALPPELVPAATRVVEATAQAMLEAGRLARPGVLDLELGRLRHPAARETLVAACGGARGPARLVLRAVAPETRVPRPDVGWGALAMAAVESPAAPVSSRVVDIGGSADAPDTAAGQSGIVASLCPGLAAPARAAAPAR